MEKLIIENAIPVFGVQVKTFPAGIGDAFNWLISVIPGGFSRPYYGISYMDANGSIAYFATAAEKEPGEAELYNCSRLILEAGEYLAVTVEQWRNKTACIKDVFHDIMKDERADKTKPAVEWYKDDNEMVCMVKTVTEK